VFGWLKSIVGITRFSGRGLISVRAEWPLICAAMNLRRMHRMGWQPA
jgi:hypothetical protein